MPVGVSGLKPLVRGDRSLWRPVMGSLALHALIVLFVVYGAVFTWHTHSDTVHSVEAYVVHGVPAPKPAATPAPEPPAPVATPTPPAPDVAAETERHEAEQRRAAEAKAEAVRVEAAKADAARLQATKVAEEQSRRQAAEKAAAAKAAADKAAAEKAAAEKARAQKSADAAAAKKLADDLAREKADLTARRSREADLARQLDAESQADAKTAAQAGLLARYRAELAARIQRAWIRPPTAKAGLKCTVHVTQVPGGTVTGVRVGDCNADPVVRRSIEEAVYRASPLPPPPDPSLFDRNLTLEFAPDA